MKPQKSQTTQLNIAGAYYDHYNITIPNYDIDPVMRLLKLIKMLALENDVNREQLRVLIDNYTICTFVLRLLISFVALLGLLSYLLKYLGAIGLNVVVFIFVLRNAITGVVSFVVLCKCRFGQIQTGVLSVITFFMLFVGSGLMIGLIGIDLYSQNADPRATPVDKLVCEISLGLFYCLVLFMMETGLAYHNYHHKKIHRSFMVPTGLFREFYNDLLAHLNITPDAILN